MKRILLLMLIFACTTVLAQNLPITVLPTRGVKVAGEPTESKIQEHVRSKIDITKYRHVRVQSIRTEAGKPDHYLVYLHSKTLHRVDFAMIKLDERYNMGAVQMNYKLLPIDILQQIPWLLSPCPDTSIEFIAFAPNDNDLEQNVTKDVASAAEKAGLKTKRLLRADATRQNYLNYMACPKLRGNFYDGDANPQVITTVDGVLTYDDINKHLAKAWNYRVTNIWLACEAYNNPMLSAVRDTAQSKKYGAGINDLAIGPSDNAGACTMKDGIAHKPLTQSFNSCYSQYDTPSDHWGFGGSGTDDFWHP